MNTALGRYRVMAYVVGVVLIVLVLVAMPLKYLADEPALVEAVGPVHGFLYMVYLAAAYDLSRRRRWPARRTVGVLLAGTVPFVSFVVERRVTRDEQRQLVRG
jgi:integral membrane protein